MVARVGDVYTTEVAKQDKQLFDIQSIVTHRFKGNKKTLTNIQEKVA